MRASVGGWSLLNIFIVFFIILAFMLSSVVLYYKGYKVNSAIAKVLEAYEGYNAESSEKINGVLKSLGYRTGGNGICISGYDENPLGVQCVHDFKLTCSEDRRNHGDGYVSMGYISYKITTYIYIDLPMGLPSIKVPVTARSNPIYQFTGSNNALGCEEL